MEKELNQRDRTILEYFKDTLAKGKMSLLNIAAGAIIEKFDQALNNEVLPNIKDINTIMKAREIILKVAIVPVDEGRHTIKYSFAVQTKLAHHEAVSGTADVNLDERGRVFAKEKDTSMPQLPFNNVINVTNK